jgi:NAD(P)-dependent dehydrogenase (short-subunit alcohol dehydrogenase family)
VSHSCAKAVLVTGASSGIGQATVELLAASGFRVFAGLRRPSPGMPLAEPPAGAEAIELDVTSADNAAAAVARIDAACPEGLFALVNNAGIAPPGAVELTDVDELRRILEVNTLAPLRLIQLCLPLLRRGRGRIVNMSSMNGKLAMPMVGAYSASKFALEALSDTLRVELRPWGVTVSLVRPGQVCTPIFHKAAAALAERQRAVPAELADGYGKLYARALQFNNRGANAATTPQAVARAVLRILRARRPKPMYLVGGDAWGIELAYLATHTRVMDWILAAAMGVNRRLPAKDTQPHAASNGAANVIPPQPPATSPPPAHPGTPRSS